MSGPRPARASRVVVVLAWALAVLVAGTVTSWAVTVISGEQGPARDRVLAASQVTEKLAAQRSAASAAPSVAASAPATSSPPSPAAVPTVEPSDAPSPTASLPPVEPPAPPAPSVPPAPIPAPTTAEVARTWDVAGGQVGASCRGSALSLLYATPVDGWTVDVKHAGSDELEVTFRQEHTETTVHGHCVGGVPTQDTDQDQD